MTQKDKELLIKDLCARLPYWPHVKTVDGDDAYIVGLDDTEEGLFYVHILEDGDSYDTTMSVENFKPYLRSLSIMTEKEKEEESDLWNEHYTNLIRGMLDFYCSHHLDWNNFISQGLALEAPEGMYK